MQFYLPAYLLRLACLKQPNTNRFTSAVLAEAAAASTNENGNKYEGWARDDSL